MWHLSPFLQRLLDGPSDVSMELRRCLTQRGMGREEHPGVLACTHAKARVPLAPD